MTPEVRKLLEKVRHWVSGFVALDEQGARSRDLALADISAALEGSKGEGDELTPQGDPMTAEDMLAARGAFLHVAQRQHAHQPEACDGCANVERFTAEPTGGEAVEPYACQQCVRLRAENERLRASVVRYECLLIRISHSRPKAEDAAKVLAAWAAHARRARSATPDAPLSQFEEPAALTPHPSTPPAKSGGYEAYEDPHTGELLYRPRSATPRPSEVGGELAPDPPLSETPALLVHLSDWAQQPDIRIACDQSYTTPKWGPRSGKTDTEGVYEADDGRLYAFSGERGEVTCPACVAKLPPPDPRAELIRKVLEKERAQAAAKNNLAWTMAFVAAVGADNKALAAPLVPGALKESLDLLRAREASERTREVVGLLEENARSHEGRLLRAREELGGDVTTLEWLRGLATAARFSAVMIRFSYPEAFPAGEGEP